MTLVVETGAGTPGANAYCAAAFVTSYLTDRGRSTENGWTASAVKDAKVIAATDYIDTRWGQKFRGYKLLEQVPGRQASGLLTLASLPLEGEELELGLKTYTFTATLTDENDVLIGATIAECVANLVGAIEQSGDAGTAFEEDTLVNYEAGALDQSPDVAFYARAAGENGNLIALSTDITGATISGAFLAGGLDTGPQPLAFPRRSLYSRGGYLITGVPLSLRQATAEYAVRAMLATLAPDPTVDASLQQVSARSVSIGPLSKSVTFAGPATLSSAIKPYPAADRLLLEFLNDGGGCIR